MKGLLLLITVIAVFPLGAVAMDPITDEDMAHVVGKAGVSFFVDITMNISIATLAWGDSDGLAPGPYNPWAIDTAGGYVGVTGLNVTNLSVRPRTDMSFPVSSSAFWPGASAIDVCNGTPCFRALPGAWGIQ